ncbi:hypothetical protein GCM10009555_018190 [Acrocarpospora macrocephala]|uniref:Uncharacterized protein n=1 Tax=Acrocarpospora macrocephala TaxID=150177 RepID=A0A5M3WGW3_9ACTN|nr:hypothetical protein [Acrocarpospora macrocephala]GES07479.1 hypothetical protein Amac_010740 [Acrocarpospora macrocephala]
MSAITPPTPDNIAAMLTDSDNDYHDGNDWHLGISAAGNVVSIEVTPHDVAHEELPVERFEAHVFAVEPAPPVASAPVELDAETARELTYDGHGATIDGWTVVAQVETGRSRWTSHHRLVIRNETGEHFAATFRRGLTEMQETQPWEDEQVAKFTPVAPRAKVVRTVEWVKPPAPAPDLLIDPDCRDGKCGSCVGGPCEHGCHQGGGS